MRKDHIFRDWQWPVSHRVSHAGRCGDALHQADDSRMLNDELRCPRGEPLARPHASLGYKPPAPEVFVPTFAAWPASSKLTLPLGHSM